MKKNSYVEKLNWDSTFFRQNIGKITLSDRNDILTLNNLENNNQYDVIYVFSNVLLFDDIVEMCLTNSIFIHVDRKVTLELNLDLDHNKYEDFDDISIASNVSNVASASALPVTLPVTVYSPISALLYADTFQSLTA